jgi:hypothetical protein
MNPFTTMDTKDTQEFTSLVVVSLVSDVVSAL